MYFNLKMYDECIAALEKAIKLKPTQKIYKNLKKSATEEIGSNF
jgi:hypothetical protein